MVGIAFDNEHGAVLGADETLAYLVIEKRQQRVEEAVDIQQPDGFLVMTELRPRPNLEQLLERPGSAWKRKERIGAIGHHRFALVHRAHLMQFGQTGMRELALDQRPRN